MADTARGEVVDAVDEMAAVLSATWDAPLNWAATTEAMIDVIVSIGLRLTGDEFAVLVATTAMARRQALKADEEVGHG